MKISNFIIIFLLTIHVVCGQSANIDSLKNIISQQRGDTTEVNALVNLADLYSYVNIDLKFKYAQKGLLLAEKLNYSKGEASCFLALGGANGSIGNFSQSLLFLFKAFVIYEQLRDEDGINATHLFLQGTYREAGDYNNALVHAFKAKQLAELNDRKGTIVFTGARMIPLILAEIRPGRPSARS